MEKTTTTTTHDETHLSPQPLLANDDGLNARQRRNKLRNKQRKQHQRKKQRDARNLAQKLAATEPLTVQVQVQPRRVDAASEEEESEEKDAGEDWSDFEVDEILEEMQRHHPSGVVAAGLL